MGAELKRPEVRLAFLVVWLALSLAIAGILAAPRLFSGEAIARAAPACIWKAQFHRECPGCGLVRSFLRLSEGQLTEAFAANRAGPFVYAAFAVNELVLAGWLLRRAAASGKKPRARAV